MRSISRRRFPDLEWQPSDAHADALASIAAWRATAGLPNVREPLVIDAASPDWPIGKADALLNINMVHISPWASALGLIAGAARVLPAGGSADPLWAVAQGRHRDRAQQSRLRRGFEAARSRVGPEAGRGLCRGRDRQGFGLIETRPMPANNLMLLLRCGTVVK